MKDRQGKQYTSAEKLAYYKSKLQDRKTSDKQRAYAEKRIAQLQRGGKQKAAPTKATKATKARKYTAAERRAYNIGYGAGLVGVPLHGDAIVNLTDSRQGPGQDPHLTETCWNGIRAGKADRQAGQLPFERRRGGR